MHYTAKGGFEFVEKCKHIEEEFYPTVLNYLCFHISHLRIIFTELNRLTLSSIIAQKFCFDNTRQKFNKDTFIPTLYSYFSARRPGREAMDNLGFI